MSDCKPTPSSFHPSVKLIVECTSPLVGATLYRQFIGSLIYLTHNIIDLSFVVSMISRLMQQPHESHSHEDKMILIYLQGALHYGVFYLSIVTVSLYGYTNSDWEGDSSD